MYRLECDVQNLLQNIPVGDWGESGQRYRWNQINHKEVIVEARYRCIFSLLLCMFWILRNKKTGRSGRYYLCDQAQHYQLTLTSDKSCWYHVYPDLMHWVGHSSPVVYFPQNPESQTKYEETSDKIKLRNILRRYQKLFKGVEAWKTNNDWETITAKEESKKTWGSECSVVPQLGFQNRTSTCSGKTDEISVKSIVQLIIMNPH